MNRLGGWWRLWIVLTLIYGAITIAAAITAWPSAADVRHTPSLVDRLKPDSQALLQTTSPSMDDLMQSLREADKEGDVERATSIAQTIRDAQDAPWILAPYAVTGPNGHSFTLPASATETEIDAFTTDYDRVLNEETSDQRVHLVRAFLLLLTIPPLVVLILAFAAVWIWRGFRHSRGAP